VDRDLGRDHHGDRVHGLGSPAERGHAAAHRDGLSSTSTPDELPLGRLEAFSDGVFAIAITLLVLELGVDADAADHLLSSILHEWPAYLAYVTSFLTIGVIWLKHSAITGALQAADSTLYRLNLLVLLLVSFLPFPTKLVTEFIREDSGPQRVATVFYGITLLALSIALTVFVRYAVEHGRLVKEDVSTDSAQAAKVLQPSFALYGISIGISLLLPTVGVALYLATALYLGIPVRTIRRLLNWD
jgi:uncharacterized membrane protein